VIPAGGAHIDRQGTGRVLQRVPDLRVYGQSDIEHWLFSGCPSQRITYSVLL
jgi:hypothetical protein